MTDKLGGVWITDEGRVGLELPFYSPGLCYAVKLLGYTHMTSMAEMTSLDPESKCMSKGAPRVADERHGILMMLKENYMFYGLSAAGITRLAFNPSHFQTLTSCVT